MTNFDRAAEIVRERGMVRLEDLLSELAGEPADAVENAMRLRGIAVEGGELRPVDAIPDFSQAALMAVELAGRPMLADEIVTATRLPDTAIPLMSLGQALQDAGLFLIPGVGWWTDKSWTAEDGQVFYRRSRSRQGEAVLKLFVKHGWPLHASEIERMTDGLVRVKALENREDTFGGITNIGLRMYAPEIEASRYVVPMSRTLAREMLAIEPGEPIKRKAHYRRFVIALLMGRARWAQVKRGTTIKGGPRAVCVRIKLTETGRAMLERMAISRRATIPDLV